SARTHAGDTAAQSSCTGKLSRHRQAICPASATLHKSAAAFLSDLRTVLPHTGPRSSNTLLACLNPRPFRLRAPRSPPRDSFPTYASSSAMRTATSHLLVRPSAQSQSILPANAQCFPSTPPATSAPSPRRGERHRSFSTLLAPLVNSWQPSRSSRKQ